MRTLPTLTLLTLTAATTAAWVEPSSPSGSFQASNQDPSRATHLQDPGEAPGATLADAPAWARRVGARRARPDSAAAFVWADLDLDGRLEVLVLQPDGRSAMLRDAGDGRFEECAAELGLADLGAVARATFEDVDGDADPDLFVLGLDGSGRLLRNERDLGFRDVTAESGLDLGHDLVEAAWRDVDDDALPDLLLVTPDGARLVRNLGGSLFEEVGAAQFPESAPVGLAAPVQPTGAPLPATLPDAGVERPDVATASAGGSKRTPLGSGPVPRVLAGTPNVMPAPASMVSALVCAERITDQDTGDCIEASSLPTLGALYPLSSDLFVEAGTGLVGVNTTSPTARLDVDAAGDAGLTVRSNLLGASLVQFSSVNTSPFTPTLFAKAGDGGTSGYFQEKLSVGTLFTGLPSPRATLGIDADDNAELRMIGSAVETVELLANEVDGNGAQLDLRLANGLSTITLDAEAGSAAAEVSMFDRNAGETVQIRSESSVTGSGGQLALRRAQGPNAIVLEAETSKGAELSMRNAANIETVNLVSEEAPGNGAQLILYRAAGFPTIVLDAEQGLSSQVSLYNSNAIETIEMVSEEGSGDGAQILLKKYDGTPSIILDASQGADGRITTETLEITGGADLVEGFDASAECVPGSVVALDPARPGALILSSTAYDPCVAGVVSGAGSVRPGLQLGQRDVLDGDTLVALTGRVYVRCTDENGPIRPGDLLTSSSTPGHAMRASDAQRAFGAVIGKAMGVLEGERGLVLVLVGLQ